jgi:hypothetical protein
MLGSSRRPPEAGKHRTRHVHPHRRTRNRERRPAAIIHHARGLSLIRTDCQRHHVSAHWKKGDLALGHAAGHPAQCVPAGASFTDRESVQSLPVEAAAGQYVSSVGAKGNQGRIQVAPVVESGLLDELAVLLVLSDPGGGQRLEGVRVPDRLEIQIKNDRVAGGQSLQQAGNRGGAGRTVICHRRQ